MERQLLEFKCDYCHDKMSFDPQQPSEEVANWIQMVVAEDMEVPTPDGKVVKTKGLSKKHFCRRLCAVNFLRTDGPVIIPR